MNAAVIGEQNGICKAAPPFIHICAVTVLNRTEPRPCFLRAAAFCVHGLILPLAFCRHVDRSPTVSRPARGHRWPSAHPKSPTPLIGIVKSSASASIQRPPRHLRPRPSNGALAFAGSSRRCGRRSLQLSDFREPIELRAWVKRVRAPRDDNCRHRSRLRLALAIPIGWLAVGSPNRGPATRIQ
jgi:hypothetical protein